MTRRTFTSTAALVAYTTQLAAEGIEFSVRRSPISIAFTVTVTL